MLAVGAQVHTKNIVDLQFCMPYQAANRATQGSSLRGPDSRFRYLRNPLGPKLFRLHDHVSRTMSV
jgi:hypothetical protein